MSMYLIMSFKIHEANLIKSNEETASLSNIIKNEKLLVHSWEILRPTYPPLP